MTHILPSLQEFDLIISLLGLDSKTSLFIFVILKRKKPFHLYPTNLLKKTLPIKSNISHFSTFQITEFIKCFKINK